MKADEVHARRINSVLARLAAVRGYVHEATAPRTPLDELLAAEEGEVEQEERSEVLVAMLCFLAADGPHPGAIVRRFYALAKALRPELIGHMSVEEIGLMMGETPAAVSWRIKRIFSDYQRERGVKGFKAVFQKSDSAREAYARAQRGNNNRRGNHPEDKAA